jgi:hypothetical protein
MSWLPIDAAIAQRDRVDSVCPRGLRRDRSKFESDFPTLLQGLSIGIFLP